MRSVWLLLPLLLASSVRTIRAEVWQFADPAVRDGTERRVRKLVARVRQQEARRRVDTGSKWTAWWKIRRTHEEVRNPADSATSEDSLTQCAAELLLGGLLRPRHDSAGRALADAGIIMKSFLYRWIDQARILTRGRTNLPPAFTRTLACAEKIFPAKKIDLEGELRRAHMLSVYTEPPLDPAYHTQIQPIVSVVLSRRATYMRMWQVQVHIRPGFSPLVAWGTLKPLTQATAPSILLFPENAQEQRTRLADVWEDLWKSAGPASQPAGAVSDVTSKRLSMVPVFISSSSGLRESSTRNLEILLESQRFVNSWVPEVRPDEVAATPFSAFPWRSVVSGRNDALSIFIAANHMRGSLESLRRLKSLMRLSKDQESGVERSLSLDMIRHTSLVGVMNVGATTVQLAVPVPELDDVEPLPVMLLSDYLPPGVLPELRILAATMRNLGQERAFGFLVRLQCGNRSGPDGVCRLPCLNPGYRADCVSGPPAQRDDPFWHTQTGRLAVKENYLRSTAMFCDASNRLTRSNSTSYKACAATGFNVSEPLETRLKIPTCEEVHGTGDFAQCVAAIESHLMHQSLPANDIMSSNFPYTPRELGTFLRLRAPLFVTGPDVVRVILVFKALELMPADHLSLSAVSGDFAHLANAAKIWCSVPLGEKVPGVQANFFVTLQQWDWCFLAAYAYTLLKVLGVSETGGPAALFRSDLRTPHGDIAGHFGWEAGVLLRELMQPDFGYTAYSLGVSHWREVLSSNEEGNYFLPSSPRA